MLVEILTSLIISNKETFENVPDSIKPQVKKMLMDIGLGNLIVKPKSDDGVFDSIQTTQNNIC